MRVDCQKLSSVFVAGLCLCFMVPLSFSIKVKEAGLEKIDTRIVHSVRNKDMERTRHNRNCDIYEGSWVYDESYPLFNSSACPLIREEFDCIRYGRPNLEHLKYRWQPLGCDLPRYMCFSLQF